MRKKNKEVRDAPKKRIKEKMVDGFDLPKEILLNIPKIIMFGNKSIVVQNYKGILEYEDGRVKINTGSGIIRISGNRILIKEINTEVISVEGVIKAIEFLDFTKIDP